jgi:hypothetical protein
MHPPLRLFSSFVAIVWAISLSCPARGEDAAVVADFTRPGHGWRPNGAMEAVETGPDGWGVKGVGEDPYLVGPAVELSFPPQATKLLLELEADSPGDFRCFAAVAGTDFTETHAVQLVGDRSGVYRGVIATIGSPIRFRLDPPDAAAVALRRLRATPILPVFTLPPRPAAAGPIAPVTLPDDALEAGLGAVRVHHDPRHWNRFAVSVAGERMADSFVDEPWWMVDGDRAVAIDPALGTVEVAALAGGYEVVATVREADDPAQAATWTLTRRVEAAGRGVTLATTVAVDRRRELVHLPWLTLLAGLERFGARKSQALLPGVEYLADEPSSNEKEIRGPAANRRIVDPLDVCFPTMVIAADGRWLAIDWDIAAGVASPVFDSPDRILGSGGHLLGLWSPMAGGGDPLPARFPGELAVLRGTVVEPGSPLRLDVTFRGGFGDSVVRGVADRFRGTRFPEPPETAGGLDGACRLLAHGWLDSAAREGTEWRHAVWQGRFEAQPAADAPACMLWLAARLADPVVAPRLRRAAAEAFAKLPAGATGGVGHCSRPALPLLLRGDRAGIAAAIAEAGERARRIAAEIIAADGRLPYVAGKTDYAATLGSNECNGFTAIAAETMLEDAALGGDEETIASALAALDLVARAYPAGEVPRGAQPWEMPLHTPDILAAARLLRCHLLGHLLDGQPRRLDQARAWAWAGVPFVYLRDPLPGAEVGRHATIGVLGATGWEAPLWIGQPVQWCGLVYAAALQELARVDVPLGPAWGRLATGITRCGVAMTFPAADPARRGGLLPDYWLFRPGRGDGPAINPATLQASLAEAFDATPLVTATRLPGSAGHGGHVVHVAGNVERATVSDGGATLDIVTWPETPSLVLVTRVAGQPQRVAWNGVAIDTAGLVGGCLAVPVEGRGTLTIEW